MEHLHFVKNWLPLKLSWILLMFATLFVQSLALPLKNNCSNALHQAALLTPHVDIGGYESFPIPELKFKRDIFIYWEIINLKETKICNKKFQYRAFYEVLNVKDRTFDLVESNITHENHAEFYGLETTVGYNFRVYIVSKYGRSKEYASIYVPYDNEIRFLNPLTLEKKILNDGSTYELTWKYDGRRSEHLYYFTLFWCENDEFYSPYQCNGLLRWMHFENFKSGYNFTVPNRKTYTFAISVNGQRWFNDQEGFMSAGMVWESCHNLHNSEIIRLKKIWISDFGVHRLGLRWKLDCSDSMGLVTNYVIFYCPVKSVGDSCHGKMKSRMISYNEMSHKKATFIYINSLEPNTTYSVTLMGNTMTNKVLKSNFIFGTTLNRGNNLKLLPTFIDAQEY